MRVTTLRLAWSSDCHLNFTDVRVLTDQVRAMSVSALILSGDIAEADTLAQYLNAVSEDVGIPVYFVLGNHDFYGSGINDVRALADNLSASSRGGLTWLREHACTLNDRWTLVGVDGWGDARNGDAQASPVLLNDWRHIRDFHYVRAMHSRAARIDLCERLGTQEAEALRGPLREALSSSNALVITHVPPFPESAWHEGAPSNAYWLPWFSCRAVGDVLMSAAKDHPDRELLVLCGHTHGSGEYQAAHNLRVRTGEAAYGEVFVREITLR